MTIKLISFPLCPFVQRAVIALQEKGAAYEIDYIDLESPPEWFRKRSPLGKVPLLLVDDKVVFESAVILDYLDETHPPALHPKDPLLRAQHKAWIAFGSELLVQQHGLVIAESESDFHKRYNQLQADLMQLDGPIAQGHLSSDRAISLVDVAFAPLFLRISILQQYRPEIASIYTDSLANWASRLLARHSTRASVLPDFEQHFVDFFRQKGSWALAKPKGSP